MRADRRRPQTAARKPEPTHAQTTTPVIIWEELNATQNQKELFFSKAGATALRDCLLVLYRPHDVSCSESGDGPS